jgi:hypothetical protein
MDRKHLIAYLQRSAIEDAERTPFCPDDQDIAAFVDGDLDNSSRVLIERHLPDCPACVSRIGQLTRLLRTELISESDETPSANKTLFKAIPHWAAAATVVLAIIWAGWSPDTVQVDDVRDVRNVESVLAPPQILAPDSGVLASRDGVLIRWTEVPGSLYYEVRVVSDIGDLLSETRVQQTRWAISDEIELEPGREYYIRVDAYLSDSKAISSQHIPFRLRD